VLRSRNVLRFAVAAANVFVAPVASAFCRTTTDTAFVPTSARPCDTANAPLFWASKCVGYSVARAASVQVTLATATQIIDQAFAEWARHDCSEGGASCGAGQPSLTAQNVGPVDCAAVEHTQGGSNANVIAFRDGVWPHEDSALALTTVTFRVDGGEIFDVDMEIHSNPGEVKLAVADPVPSGQYDLRSIVTHEAGHFLGLAHTARSNSQATMFEAYRPGETFMRDLTADDVCGLCTAYPPARNAACEPSPRGGLGQECGGGDPDRSCHCGAPGAAGGGGAVAVLMLLAMATRRRR
jgi:hypothetical protein